MKFVPGVCPHAPDSYFILNGFGVLIFHYEESGGSSNAQQSSIGSNSQNIGNSVSSTVNVETENQVSNGGYNTFGNNDHVSRKVCYK